MAVWAVVAVHTLESCRERVMSIPLEAILSPLPLPRQLLRVARVGHLQGLRTRVSYYKSDAAARAGPLPPWPKQIRVA